MTYEFQTRYYVTIDADGDRIAEDAEIFAFETYEDAREYVEASYRDGMDEGETLDIQVGDFGDCWLKLRSDPDAEEIAPFHADDVIIHRPNQHPGGDVCWVTPRPDVLVAKIDRDAGDNAMNIHFALSANDDGYNVADWFAGDAIEQTETATTAADADAILRTAYLGPDVDGVEVTWTIN